MFSCLLEFAIKTHSNCIFCTNLQNQNSPSNFQFCAKQFCVKNILAACFKCKIFITDKMSGFLFCYDSKRKNSLSFNWEWSKKKSDSSLSEIAQRNNLYTVFNTKVFKMTWVSHTNHMVVIISQCLSILNEHVVYLKFIQCYISIKYFKK